MIETDTLWEMLTVRLDESGFQKIFNDSKVNHETNTVYVEEKDDYAFEYYKSLAENGNPDLNVIKMPVKPDHEWVKSVAEQPGVVASVLTVTDHTEGTPYIALGGNYYELDVAASYFSILALMHKGEINLCKQILSNISYMIGHVHTLKASNRSYHQHVPALPFYTSIVRAIAAPMESEEERRKFLTLHIKRGILEYERVWNTPQSYESIGLNVFPKVEVDNDTLPVLIPNSKIIPVNINMLLYKTEMDLSNFIEFHTESGKIEVEGQVYTPEVWRDRAQNRLNAIHKYLWNEELSGFHDYHLKQEKNINLGRADFIYALWSGALSDAQSKKLVDKILVKHLDQDIFNYNQDTEAISVPQQIILWEGLKRYGNTEVLHRIQNKWRSLIEEVYKSSKSLPLVIDQNLIKAGYDKHSYSWTLASYELTK